MTAYVVVNSKTCSCERAKLKPPYIKISAKSIVGQKTAKPLHVLNRKQAEVIMMLIKVSKGAKIRNQYNQVTHLVQETNGKVTNLHLDTTNESQEVSPFPASDHKAQINRQRHNKHNTEKNIKDPQKKYRLGTISKNILLDGLNRFHGTIQMWINTLFAYQMK